MISDQFILRDIVLVSFKLKLGGPNETISHFFIYIKRYETWNTFHLKYGRQTLNCQNEEYSNAKMVDHHWITGRNTAWFTVDQSSKLYFDFILNFFFWCYIIVCMYQCCIKWVKLVTRPVTRRNESPNKIRDNSKMWLLTTFWHVALIEDIVFEIVTFENFKK